MSFTAIARGWKAKVVAAMVAVATIFGMMQFAAPESVFNYGMEQLKAGQTAAAATANATRPPKRPSTFRSTSCTSCHCRKGMDRCGRPSYTTHRGCGTPACWTPQHAAPLGANRYCPNAADR